MTFDMLASMFIELRRTFQQLTEGTASDADLHQFLASGERVGWDDLVREHRVVILSEAGSGKTEEIRNVARRLRSEGRAGFFLRLEHVARDFEIAFEEGSYEEFHTWVASDDEGWILLDSVDEARLRDPGDFEAAIRRLGRLLISAKQRVHILITGRTSAWRPKTDLALCVNNLPFVRPSVMQSVEKCVNGRQREIRAHNPVKKNEEAAFKIVALDDLTTDQVETFANAKGVVNTRAFLDAVERADAWSFTSRPQDLEELVEFWNDHGRIGSRLELMRNSVDRRLIERDQDRADARPLSNERARLGAKLVAAASTMSHEPTIRVADGAENVKGLPIKSILIDWNDLDCATLLARPIFDEAIYGTVRFHHRSVREYLTAEWFADLLKHETSRRKIQELFFREQYGLAVVVPVMRPILPWLAIFDDNIRDRVRQVAPEVLFEGGDPSQLPVETRRQILHQVCDQLARGATNRSVMDYAAVQRFASADLTVDIKELIRKFEANDDLLWFLLCMVWQGEIAGALPEAKRVALSRTSDRSARTAAFRAVAALGSAEDKVELRCRFRDECAVLDRGLLAQLVNTTKPTTESIDWLFECLRKVEDERPYSVDQLTEQLSGFIEQADTALLPSIIDRANVLLEEPPVLERRHCEISARFTWLLKAVAPAVERIVKAQISVAFRPSSVAVLHKLLVSRHRGTYESSYNNTELAAVVRQWPELKLALFWYGVEHDRKWLGRKKNERLTDWWNVSIASYVRFGAGDFQAVLKEVTTRPFIDDKLIALSLAFTLYVDAGRRSEQRRMLKKVAQSDVLKARLWELMHPPPQSAEARKYKKMQADWRRRDEKERQKEQAHRDSCRKYLTENIEKLRDPGLDEPDHISEAQYYLHERMRKGRHGSSFWSEGNWESLKAEFGEEVAQAFRDGAVAYWRRYKPKVRSEGAPGNTTPLATVFGLTGLAIEAREVEIWPATLNEAEAELAFRYAMFELNGFPPWLPRLFAKFPDVICRMALQEIHHELATEEDNKESHYLLYDISWNGDWLWNAVAPSLYEVVSANEPKNLSNLRYILNIIQGSSVPDERIAELASRKSTLEKGAQHAACWFATWTGVEPGAAIPALEIHLASIPGDDERATFAMLYVTQLLGGRESGSSRVREAYRTPEYLKSLYLLMHRNIRQEEDMDRAGQGVYSPGLRDNAQKAREQLFALLTYTTGKGAFVAVEAIARVHPVERLRPWFKLQAKTRAELDADNSPWSLVQVREFWEDQERTPANHRDLFDLAVMRLLDLKDDLERGDSSNASILRVVKDEVEIRKYVGNWCRQTSRRRYSIPQEEELADAKRPDFRWHGAGLDAPVPMELKLADNWAGPALFERLQVQLCGDYLRDVRSRRGIFLLFYRGDKNAWELPASGTAVDFEGLVQALQGYWSHISGSYPCIDEIRVIGIDLTKRSQPPKR